VTSKQIAKTITEVYGTLGGPKRVVPRSSKLHAIWEIAYQLAVQNERAEKMVAILNEVEELPGTANVKPAAQDPPPEATKE